MIKIHTIGVYGYTEKEFFDKLLNNKIETFIDVRMRRGVRGAKYSFVNSLKLQKRLESLGIKYIHIKELAPTSSVRNKQKEEDLSRNIQKRKRERLGHAFINAYEKEILSYFNFDNFIKSLKASHKNIVLFCVERNPEACHRSIITNHLKKLMEDIEIIHL